MEIWELTDREGRPTGETAIRGEAIPEGRYHTVAEVLLRHRDGDYLLMHRDPKKILFPGRWEATAGGSALPGEDALRCVRRELREETGLEAESFREVALHIYDEDHCRFHSFVAETAADKSAVVLQPGETDAFRWATEAEFIAYLRSGEAIVSQRDRYTVWFRGKGFL